MNDIQTQKSEIIASKVMRALAIIGLIAVLALVTWVTVQGVRLLTGSNGNLSAVIGSLRGSLSTAPAESLTFTLDTKTLATGENADVNWTYEGNATPTTYTFSYECGTDTTLSVMENTGWKEVACNTPYETSDSKLRIIATNNATRFADVQLHVETGDLSDTTVVTVVNTDIHSPLDATVATSTATTSDQVDSNNASDSMESAPVQTPRLVPVTTQPATPRPTQQTTVVQHPSTPTYSGPADLALSIEETGVIMDVDDEDTFFAISPIPSNKTAAVKFTVTNKGGATSGTWRFKAELPLEGDKDYNYTSPVQAPILSGMQVEYTLSFDEISESDRGTIRIELIPTDSRDADANNDDAVTIRIDKR